MKNNIYTIGLVLIIISFIVCTISFYFIVLGLPFFIIGALIVFASQRDLKTKLITTILPIILWIPATYVFLYFYGITTPETFLIPANFEGKFRVVYGEKCGIEPQLENGRRILRIPTSGILIVKPEFESGRIDHEYFLVEPDGNKTKINQEIYFKDKNKEYPSVLLSGTGSMSTESVEAINFSDFWLYNKDTTDQDYYEKNMRFDSLTTVFVDSCRRRRK